MRTIRATGDLLSPPTLSVSSGRGNGGSPEVHLILRDDSGESSKSVMGWFDKDALLDAIHDADARVRFVLEVGEPA